MNAIEGSLSVLWENYTEPTATPRYRLLFARYKNLKGGGQPHKNIVGTDALRSYLVGIGFTPKDADRWIKQAHEEQQTISIPNVMMPEGEIAPYELSA